ncbi:G/U mismatch-specific uracil-DNA glycosylase [Anaerovirgula multivorans]|uniref:G/U mismatch-specific uracil-DNA glycosylase n=1 Tax=Anaerovirgula multivorans TaxID=312168 RepID=A0A239K2Z7_9FIRM|nr:DNA-deoxyinosine glycosylase [Anaerovirgula multivorans]SNT12052.1 G/U mismatch-specific uracil-DNA glycosylase [Anaerovirgula multivorans]
MKILSLETVIDYYSKVLILGSMPSVQSLQLKQYYANPRNHFWTIIYTLFNLQAESDYVKRLEFIKSKNIALWDVIHTCERQGSLDASIRDEEPNDLEFLLNKYNKIEAVFFNGTKAANMFNKYFDLTSFTIEFHRLLSTTPVPGKNIKSLEEKIEAWSSIKNYI